MLSVTGYLLARKPPTIHVRNTNLDHLDLCLALTLFLLIHGYFMVSRIDDTYAFAKIIGCLSSFSSKIINLAMALFWLARLFLQV